MTPSQRRTFALVNAVAAPWWLAMILLPRAAVTGWLMQRMPVALATLGVTYTGLLVRGLGAGPVEIIDPDALRTALGRPDVFLAGWAHYVAFDLFVGRWIWRTALAEDRGCRLALLLTFMAGPAGLTLFLAQRRRRPAPAATDA